MCELIALALLASSPDIEALIEGLASDVYEEREDAMRALVRLGPDSRPRLERAVAETRDLEVVSRLRWVLQRIDRMVHAEAALMVVTARGVEFRAPDKRAASVIERLDDGYACLLRDVVYDRERPLEAWEALLLEEIARPFDVDPPAGLEMLARVGGFRSLVPALRERMEATRDPLVRRMCKSAIERQEAP